MAFWQAFSSHFGEAGRGVVFFIGDGNKENGVYQNSSFFASFEFPMLNSRVNRLVVINIYDCNSSMVEKCGEGTLKVLEDEAIGKYGKDVGYNCEEVCGNASDFQETSLLANKTLQIIKEEQNKGNQL